MATAGQRVNYVMKDGGIRPLDIVRVWNETMVNGLVLLDGTNDEKNIPLSVYTTGTGSKGEPVSVESPMLIPMVTQTVAPHSAVPLCYLWVTSVHLDENKAPGTFHFAEEEETEADTTLQDSITAMGEAFQSQVLELSKRVKALESGQTTNQKQPKNAPSKPNAAPVPDAASPVSDAAPSSPATPAPDSEQASPSADNPPRGGYSV